MLSDRTHCTGRSWADLRGRLAGLAESTDCGAVSTASDASLWLEGYGPKGSVVLVLCVAADPARTRAAVRSLFQKRGGQLGAPGSIAYLFRRAGVIRYPPGTDAERLGQLAYAAEAEEVAVATDGSVEVLTDPASLEQVSTQLAARAAGVPLEQGVLWRTHTQVRLSADDARPMLQLLWDLKQRDDVRSVYSNAEIPDEIVAEL